MPAIAGTGNGGSFWRLGSGDFYHAAIDSKPVAFFSDVRFCLVGVVIGHDDDAVFAFRETL